MTKPQLWQSPLWCVKFDGTRPGDRCGDPRVSFHVGSVHVIANTATIAERLALDAMRTWYPNLCNTQLDTVSVERVQSQVFYVSESVIGSLS